MIITITFRFSTLELTLAPNFKCTPQLYHKHSELLLVCICITPLYQQISSPILTNLNQWRLCCSAFSWAWGRPVRWVKLEFPLAPFDDNLCFWLATPNWHWFWRFILFYFFPFYIGSSPQKSGINVKEVMDTWTLQMGLPVVTIRRLNQHKATADQKVFLIDSGARPEKSSPFK